MNRANLGSGRKLAAFMVAAAVAATAGACAETMGAKPASGVFYGDAVAVGNGTVRTYIELDDGAPVELGIALSEDALSGLPTNDTAGGLTMPDGNKSFEYSLSLPAENPTPYRHATLDWNPGGHVPPGIYDVPHFDFHFYTIEESVRKAIDPADPDFEQKAANYPAAEYVPAGYVAPTPAGFPFMGVHWMDPDSPELHGEAFTKTFLYGTWDGELIFAEPMITKAYLESRPDVSEPIAVAQRYAVPGYYPASYAVRWDEQAGEYRIALGGFVNRD